jgi:lipopolysaccharide/colanic/teichoic acid biosynthesis glycosyltransferase
MMEDYLCKCYIPKDSIDLSFHQNIHHLNFFEKVQKKIIDGIGAITLFLIAIPIMTYAILKIKKESKGSIFFTQKRVGRNGKSFTCIKFRSMEEDGKFNPYTEENDTRIFPFGNTMRKTRIDEIPQIFNIFKGNMSLIGPRAEWDILVEKYEEEIPYYHERHLVKPGITGWAQVNFPYGKGVDDSYQKLMYDLYYIKNWSLWLEIKIIFKTIAVVLTKRGT